MAEGKVRMLAKGELEEVVARAREERWTKLAVVSGYQSKAEALASQGWPPHQVFFTEEGIGDEGARALASIGQHQPLPRNGEAISAWPKEDDAWLQVAEGLQALLGDLARRRGLDA